MDYKSQSRLAPRSRHGLSFFVHCELEDRIVSCRQVNGKNGRFEFRSNDGIYAWDTSWESSMCMPQQPTSLSRSIWLSPKLQMARRTKNSRTVRSHWYAETLMHRWKNIVQRTHVWARIPQTTNDLRLGSNHFASVRNIIAVFMQLFVWAIETGKDDPPYSKPRWQRFFPSDWLQDAKSFATSVLSGCLL